MSASYDRARSLLNLIADTAFMADLPAPTTSTAVTKQNCIDRLNDGAAELYNAIMATGDGDAIFLKKTSFVTDGRNPSVYALVPQDFFRLELVECTSPSTGEIFRLRQFNLDEHAALSSPRAAYSRDPFMYRLEGKTVTDDSLGQNIEILPVPPSGTTISYWYVQTAPRLAADGDMLPGFSGFETYVVTHAARAFATKFENYEQADRLSAELERLKANIIQALKYRDNAEPPRTRLVRDQPGPWRRRYWRRNF